MLGPLPDGKTLLHLGVLLTTDMVLVLWKAQLRTSLLSVCPSTLQTFCRPSFSGMRLVLAADVLLALGARQTPIRGSPSLMLELWAYKLAACAEWFALVVAHDSRTSPTTASASFEARSTAMVSGDGVWRDEPAQADRFTRIHSLLGNEHLRRLHKRRQERRLAHLLVRAGRFRQLRRLLHLADADLLYGNFILQNG